PASTPPDTSSGRSASGPRSCRMCSAPTGETGKTFTRWAPARQARTTSVAVNAPGTEAMPSSNVRLTTGSSTSGEMTKLAPARRAAVTSSAVSTVPAPTAASAGRASRSARMPSSAWSVLSVTSKLRRPASNSASPASRHRSGGRPRKRATTLSRFSCAATAWPAAVRAVLSDIDAPRRHRLSSDAEGRVIGLTSVPPVVSTLGSADRGVNAVDEPKGRAGAMIDEIRSVTVAPRWILVRVRTSDGVTGWGEAIVPKRARAVCAAVAELDRVLHGADERRIEELWHRAREGAFFRDGSVLATAAAGVEHALWDIKARRLGVPVHDLLGGPVRDRVRVYAWIGGDRPGDVVDQARTRVGQGYGAVKMNATAEFDLLESPAAVDEVVARVGALRDEFGTELDIALDFHGRVHRSMVAPLLRELEQFRLLWVEEPVAPGLDALL